MSHSEPPGNERKPDLKHAAEEVFSSEKREDIWAIIIAVSVLVLSVVFPNQVYYFFNKVLYLF
jgi:hypothetical protein